jgi:hypothetical protein
MPDCPKLPYFGKFFLKFFSQYYHIAEKILKKIFTKSENLCLTRYSVAVPFKEDKKTCFFIFYEVF